MRCVPRRTRHLCIFFLLFFCLIGVYLTFKKWNDADNSKHGWKNSYQNLDQLQQFVKVRVKSDLKLPDGVAESQMIYRNSIKKDIGFRNLENDDDYFTNEEVMARLKMLVIELFPSNWKTALDADEMMLQVKSELMDLGFNSKYSCREINGFHVGNSRYRNYYGKKNIDFARLDYTTDLVVKSLGRDHEFKLECMKMDYNPDRCEVMANYNLMRELLYLLVLDSPSVIKLEGFCLRGETIDSMISKKGAIIITEAGNPISKQTLQSFSWMTRLEMCVELVQLLLYLEDSPIGSVGLDRLHQQDFVLVGVTIKLVDLDNMHVGERSCKRNTECSIREMSSKEIPCIKDACKGRNAMNNLLWMYRIMLLDLLQNSPTSGVSDWEIQKFLSQIQELAISTKEVLVKLNSWLKGNVESPPTKPTPKVVVHFPVDNDGNNPKPAAGDVAIAIPDRNEKTTKKADSIAEPPADKPKVNNDDTYNNHGDKAKNEYARHDSANFPALMTMVMKNSAEGAPNPNYGATLFIKKESGNRGITSRPKAENSGSVTLKPKVEINTTTCLKKSLNQTLSARSARERRLFAHLGLKGVTESDWLLNARFVRIVKNLGPSQMLSDTTKGGRFKFEFDKNTVGLKKGEFILENGPSQHHIGHLVSYHVDRVLGLYLTPPSIGRNVSMSEFDRLDGHNDWMDRFRPFNMSDGSGFQGVVSMPVPPVIKTTKLEISKKETIVSRVQAFSKNQKVQLEYILLWSLVRMMQPQHGYLGYKGHLIHFEADLAFMNLKRSLLGYLYNCQFPNSVYKVLICYKCGDYHKLPKICGLGQEAIRRVKKNGFTMEDIQIGSLTSTDLIQVINNSASQILDVVEICIKSFSREKVLY